MSCTPLCSILKGEKHEISIEIHLKDKQLTFFCGNPYTERSLQEIDIDWKESGVGINNTKERLQLLYPEKHTLEIRKNNTIFEVKLEVLL